MNALENATVSDFQKISDTEAVFIIELDSHVHLKDPALVKSSLDAYLIKYPNFHSYQATIRGGLLYIHVSGIMDPDALAQYTKG